MAGEERELNSQIKAMPIAIVGMAGIFPEARNLDQYWDNIVQKVDCIREVPASRWDVADYYDPDPKALDKTYCKRGGFIPNVAFDPLEFGLPPNILEAVDVAQLLALVVAKEALEDAGYGSRSFERERTGIVLGVSMAQQSLRPLVSRLQYPIWEKVLRSRGFSEGTISDITKTIKLAYPQWEEDSFPGFLNNVVSGRVANRLDLGGLNCAVDAACASSLSALKVAVSELLEQHCDMMLAGGVDLDNSIVTYMCFSKTPAFSKRGECHPFDSTADGMLASEGIGMVVLKRLAEAERDGDRIYAVIKGIGSSSDGRFKSIYAPRPEGQARAVRAAYQNAGVSPTTVGLIEAHGTGTVAGDLCEVTALRQVLDEAAASGQSIALGSVKSQIGHTKAAAGVASLIKVALALHHKVLPATTNVTEPNPKLGLEHSALYLNTQTRPWLPVAAVPRRAGVSSFGFGGINYHAVIEEYNNEQSKAYRRHSTAHILLLTAPNVAQLIQQSETLVQSWQVQSDEASYYNLVVESQTRRIPVEQPRIGLVARSKAKAAELLQLAIQQLNNNAIEAWEHPKGVYYRPQGLNLTGRVVAVFSGQGSQYVEMGRELCLNFPELRQAYQDMDNMFRGDGLEPISSVVFPTPSFEASNQAWQATLLQNTENAQPAIGVFSAGLYKLLQQAGFKADFAVGHSFGELTALWAGGSLSDEAYFSLVKARGQAMAAPPNQSGYDTGAMIAVQGELGRIENEIANFPNVVVANYNAANQSVLAGARAAIAEVHSILQSKGYGVRQLPVSAAFHTSLVEYAQKPFAQAFEQLDFQTPKIPVYANSTGRSYPAEPANIRQTLAQHMLQPVLFRQDIESIYGAGGYCFVEFGPRNILTNLVKEILAGKPHLAIALNPSRQKDSDYQLRYAIVQLQVAGLDLTNFDPYQVAPINSDKSIKGRSISLNGSQYVSPQTKEAFEKALQNGNKGHGAEKSAVAPLGGRGDATIAQNLVQLGQQQAELAQTHRHFLATQLEYFKSMTQMMSQQQANLIQLQEQYLNSQTAYFNNVLQLIQQQNALSGQAEIAIPALSVPTVSEPFVVQPKVFNPTITAQSNPTSEVATLLVQAVSAKTGYNADMLELEMAVEADLGIDSIKLIEILTALHDQNPSLPLISPEEIGKLRTLSQIVGYLTQ